MSLLRNPIARGFVAALALSGCASLDQFDVDLKAEGALKGSLDSISPDGFPTWPAGGDVSKEVANQGVESSDIRSAKLKSGTVSVTSPEGGHLKYLESLEIFVSAPGLPDVRIAHQDADFANAKSTYDFVLDDVELAPYVTASSMTLTPRVKQRSRPMQTHQLEIKLVLHVDLTVID